MTQTFGQVLRRHRRELDISQEALAELSGVSETHIKRLERDLPDPGMTIIFRLSKALHVEPGELLEKPFSTWKARGSSSAGATKSTAS